MVNVKTAEFVVGAAAPDQFPETRMTEIVFAGRSNVGKSSLINLLLGRRALAKVGKTPGKTRQVNFFLINDAFRFVDLPGFGHARASKAERRWWGELIEAYFAAGRPIAGVLQLIDARHPDQELDGVMTNYLEGLRLKRQVVATKADKLKKGRLAENSDRIAEVHGQKPIMTSCSRGMGKLDTWRVLERWLG